LQDAGNYAGVQTVRPCSYLESDCSKNFPAIWIFVRKNLAVQTFARNFFGFFNFQTEKNTAGKISSQIFLRFSTFDRKIFRFLKFHGQKKYGFSNSGVGSVSQDLRRRRELVAELTPFFPTFAPTFFRFFNFQSKNFWDFQLSSRKILAEKYFAAKKYGRTNFRTKNFWPEKISNRASGM
jgi:hypothetical protein